MKDKFTKRDLKLLVIDIIIVVVSIIFFMTYDFTFSPLKFGNFLITILFVAVFAFAHYFAYQKMPFDEDEVMNELNSLAQAEDLQFDKYMTHLNNIKSANPEFTSVIETFNYQIESFSSKEEALNRLISLNDGKAQGFLTSKNNDVQNYLKSNLKKFVKLLIAYSAKTKKNRTSSIEEDSAISSILDSNDKLIDCYDKLLDEVARMGDDFNIEDPGLQSVIDDLQMLRTVTEEESSDEIQLFVSAGQESN